MAETIKAQLMAPVVDVAFRDIPIGGLFCSAWHLEEGNRPEDPTVYVKVSEVEYIGVFNLEISGEKYRCNDNYLWVEVEMVGTPKLRAKSNGQ